MGFQGATRRREQVSRRSTLIRAIGHCYGQPARIARKEPRKTGSHGRQKTGRQKTGGRATTEHSEHTGVREARKRGPDKNTEHTDDGDHGRTGNRGKGGVNRWEGVECRAAVAEEAWERMERGEGLGWKNKKTPAR